MNNKLVTASYCLYERHIHWLNKQASDDERSNSYILRKLIDEAIRKMPEVRKDISSQINSVSQK